VEQREDEDRDVEGARRDSQRLQIHDGGGHIRHGASLERSLRKVDRDEDGGGRSATKLWQKRAGATASIENPPDTIRPGFSVTADIVTGRRDGATAIPIQALVVRDVPKKDKAPAQGRSETEEGVYTIKDGKLEFVKVKTGIAGELMIEATEGPKPGQEIVTGPFKVLRQVKEGDKVLIEKEGGADKGGEPKRT